LFIVIGNFLGTLNNPKSLNRHPIKKTSDFTTIIESD